MVVTSAQLRAARALVGLSQGALAYAAAVSLPTLKRAEADTGPRVSPEAAHALRAALEAEGAVFIEDGNVPPNGGVGVRLRSGIAKASAAAEHGRRHLQGKTILGTQSEWERVRPASGNDRSMRAFLRVFGFDPEAQIRMGSENLDEALKPRAGTIRRQIFDKCLRSGWTVEQVNREAREIGKASVRTDADLFIGLFSGYVRLP